MAEVLNSYDELPYSARAFYDTHPNHLAAIGLLHGIEPVPLDNARILELGCANGANLIPMATAIRNARFVGVDLSKRQIEDGQQAVDALKLDNLELHAKSILDIGPDFGEFDYIICHGVYSWVPPDVQAKILAIAHDNLSPAGLAYISYNTYPGWHIRAIAREMLKFHVRNVDSVHARVGHAKAFLDFLAGSLPDSESPYAQLLKSEAELLNTSDVSYIAHEHLEEFNQPIYFRDFLERAGAANLQFVAESRPTRITERLSNETLQQIRDFSLKWDDWEQYMDFFNQRAFRRSILCHTNLHVERHPTVSRLERLYFSAVVSPEAAQPDLDPSVEVTFRSADRSMTTNHPAAKALGYLLWQRYPERLTMQQLYDDIRLLVDQWADAVDDLPALLLRMSTTGLVAIHERPTAAVLTVSDRPTAIPHVRLKAASGEVTNSEHRTVALQDFDRAVVELLDGSHDHEQLVDALVNQTLSGALRASSEGQDVQDPEQIRAGISAILPQSLQNLARLGLLIA